MLNIIIGWEKREIDFMGETLKVELHPLKVEAMMALMPFMQDIAETKSPVKMFEMQKTDGLITGQ